MLSAENGSRLAGSLYCWWASLDRCWHGFAPEKVTRPQPSYPHRSAAPARVRHGARGLVIISALVGRPFTVWPSPSGSAETTSLQGDFWAGRPTGLAQVPHPVPQSVCKRDHCPLDWVFQNGSIRFSHVRQRHQRQLCRGTCVACIGPETGWRFAFCVFRRQGSESLELRQKDATPEMAQEI